MAEFVESNPSTGGARWAVDRISEVNYPRHKLVIGADGVDDGDISAANPLPVAGTVDVSGSVAVTGALTDAQLRATAVPVSGTVAATNADLGTLAAGTKPEGGTYATGDRGYVAMAVRQDAMSSLSADGEYTPLQIGSTGRLKVSAEPAAQESTTGNITANGQTVQITTNRTSNLMIYCTGTFAGANCTFEGSLNGTNWFAVQGVRSNANTIELVTGVLGAAPAYAWEVSVNGMNFFRVRATAFVSGTQVWQFQPAPYATEPIPAAQISGTQPVSGTVTANSGTSGLTVFTDSAVNLGSSATFTGTSRDAGATPAFNLFVVNAVADQVGTVRIEKSTDNTNWRRATADVAVAANVGVELTVRVTARYHRVVYVNGAAAQGQFSLTSAYQRN